MSNAEKKQLIWKKIKKISKFDKKNNYILIKFSIFLLILVLLFIGLIRFIFIDNNQENIIDNQESIITYGQENIIHNQENILDEIENTIKATFNNTTITNIEPSVIDGFYQLEISNQVVYFSQEQELLIFGEIFTKDGASLSAQTKEKWQKKKLLKIDTTKTITIGNGPVQIIEFSDPDCPYCSKLHNWILEQNKLYPELKEGIFTRKVIMTPIKDLHPKAYLEAIHIFCSTDKEKALDQSLKNKYQNYSDLIYCEEGVTALEEHKEIAAKFGVSATPTIIINNKVIQGLQTEEIKKQYEVLLNKNVNKESQSLKRVSE